jgi:hypothetical protein
MKKTVITCLIGLGLIVAAAIHTARHDSQRMSSAESRR